MKILFFIIVLALTACSKSPDKSEYINLENSNYSVMDEINIPKEFARKSSVYGEYYTNFEDYILLGEIDGSIENSVKKTLIYYLPADFKPDDNYYMSFNSGEFNIKSMNDFSDIKGKQIKDKFIVVLSRKDVDKLYEEVFE